MNGTAVRTTHKPCGPYEKYWKRPLDFLCALLALIVFCWLLGIVALLVRIKLGSPVIFCQERPGKDEKIFKLYKFRTMTDARDADGNLLPDEVRLTKFGRLLRSTSLDELPELWNILKGDMSIVGPRPLLPGDVACMNEEQSRRHEVRPGLTGLAQCSGRNGLNWDEKLSLDVFYTERISLLYDLGICARTIGKVVRREHVSFEDPSMDVSLLEWNRLKETGTQDGKLSHEIRQSTTR